MTGACAREAKSARWPGRVSAVRGTVLEAVMEGEVPPVSSALECARGPQRGVTAVVQAHIGASRVRALAIGATRGLKRAAEVLGHGDPLTVRVGEALLGRVIDLEGNPLDGGPPIDTLERRPLRRAPPPPAERRPWSEVYETGIKVIDLFCP